jgi:hypothetical protein
MAAAAAKIERIAEMAFMGSILWLAARGMNDRIWSRRDKLAHRL